MVFEPLLIKGDCLDELKKIPSNSIDSIVTDPPYGLSNTDPAHVVEALTRWAQGERDFIPSGKGFMGKAWDAFVPPPAVWDEALRILKPGGHLLAFAGSRTFDLMTLSIRFAGFEIRDSIAWLYGSGFPKSMDVSKAIDKAAGVEFTTSPAAGVGFMGPDGPGGYNVTKNQLTRSGETTPDAAKWQGWGTALKPAFEPVVVARKPLIGTVAANVLAHATGALNIDASRIDGGSRPLIVSKSEDSTGILGNGLNGSSYGGETSQGRWPANVLLDESQAAALDAQTGAETSRFFYVAKAPKSERPVIEGVAHPTVKPLALMRWLVTLVTPPGGTVLDPFAGSGTTLEAACNMEFKSIGIEVSPEYWPLIEERIKRSKK